MGLTYNKYLEGDKIYGCKKCRTHLAVPSDLIAKTFHGRHGKAYLFDAVSNIKTAEQEERGMTTGRHLVRDISCRQCGTCVGWKYDKAYVEDQTYKEGKFILEYELLRDVK
ncbi:Putative uncharacterized protein [Taphrina deformans PYCC 5710]|uniref:Protein yippee-like n=1 Tax=Taphrina deformans (strain PYCC 5710 / ATCC 11124 / CBS 356.35 / IMI 108563 / JCM 9778 / NBRC 8474) TaxID=1097556 RepID=R4XBN8_TAPDE|nr:Putative uncharacterized protein [Taphrina deformans PYCC 5710]|eukprot:CCG83203.1 Putative uncharacterized protein [Taphrina deformans PYCC 5710]